MGCNQSTSKDVDDSARVRAPTSSVAQQSQRHQTAAQDAPSRASAAGQTAAAASPARAVPAGKKSEGSSYLSKSEHDRKLIMSGEFYKLIIDRTAGNFIDVMRDDDVTLISNVTAFDRSKQYNAVLAQSKVGDSGALVFDLPTPSKTVTGPAAVDLLAAPALSSSDKDLIHSVASAIEKGNKQVAVRFSESIVASLPTI
ncbi:hypothetical protein CAOG_05061 [Capsaspora owczarzaki ATCC 30864]|uniref:Uncharacterized protein n=1 Tax=Capsaspora owczarzaki (strain ATCC 30864) TaxID=595528 RepID=A0A0D2WSH7_CAPO3|nr:hypothetical protein CAOG_05061 [Capsaspora owczarzaki ATCC 30864]KJE94418.1 hypothetical protein CAOG_005061 [Capsaspora owczarzaki ATCC 30864]|eukprot:XP_004346746.1 hypothetical protein CAOG_05061 [Capsaspora owczarzaki ATCC 30864]